MPHQASAPWSFLSSTAGQMSVWFGFAIWNGRAVSRYGPSVRGRHADGPPTSVARGTGCQNRRRHCPADAGDRPCLLSVKIPSVPIAATLADAGFPMIQPSDSNIIWRSCKRIICMCSACRKSATAAGSVVLMFLSAVAGSRNWPDGVNCCFSHYQKGRSSRVGTREASRHGGLAFPLGCRVPTVVDHENQRPLPCATGLSYPTAGSNAPDIGAAQSTASSSNHQGVRAGVSPRIQPEEQTPAGETRSFPAAGSTRSSQ